MIDTKNIDLDLLNIMTKYPSIPTYHELGDRGVLNDVVLTEFPKNETLQITEKIDGTNARIVFTPDGLAIIGSREEFLWATYDLIGNPAMGIVSCLKPMVCNLIKQYHTWGPINPKAQGFPLFVIYGEVYGKGIGAAAKQYTATDKVGFRLFDAAIIENSLEILTWDRSRISTWRENGGQAFLSTTQISMFAKEQNLEYVPMLGTINARELPETLSETQMFLNQYTNSKASLDSTSGKSEGVVIRTPDRKTIAKLRFEDYARKRK